MPECMPGVGTFGRRKTDVVRVTWTDTFLLRVAVSSAKLKDLGLGHTPKARFQLERRIGDSWAHKVKGPKCLPTPSTNASQASPAKLQMRGFLSRTWAHNLME